MTAASAKRNAPVFRKKDLYIGKSKLLAIIAANPDNPSFRATIRTSLLWNQLCRPHLRIKLDQICLRCQMKPKTNHGASHYDGVLLSALSLLAHESQIPKADWQGFGTTTAKDFQALCDALRHQLGLEPFQG